MGECGGLFRSLGLGSPFPGEMEFAGFGVEPGLTRVEKLPGLPEFGLNLRQLTKPVLDPGEDGDGIVRKRRLVWIGKNVQQGHRSRERLEIGPRSLIGVGPVCFLGRVGGGAGTFQLAQLPFFGFGLLSGGLNPKSGGIRLVGCAALRLFPLRQLIPASRAIGLPGSDELQGFGFRQAESFGEGWILKGTGARCRSPLLQLRKGSVRRGQAGGMGLQQRLQPG